MKCCGEFHTTEFCPHCGTRLEPTHDIHGLICYLRRELRLAKEKKPSARLSEEKAKLWKVDRKNIIKRFETWLSMAEEALNEEEEEEEEEIEEE